jgi:peptidoglycan/xylan/chitin deacetylase (PgdA/CDA1 family)
MKSLGGLTAQPCCRMRTDARRSRFRDRTAMYRRVALMVLLIGTVVVLGTRAADGGFRPRWGAVTRQQLEGPPAEAMREERAVKKMVTRGLPVYCGGGRTHEVALTFDDGPGPYTPRLLAALRRSSLPGALASVPATFFLIGENAVRYPSYARLEARIGAVGSHTENHRVLTRLRRAAVRREIAAGEKSVERVLGESVQLFRPPGGHRSAAIDRIVAELKLLTVLWSVDPRDWARGATSIVTAVESDPRLVPGAIVVLHEFHPATIEALPAIVGDLRRRGLRPVSVPRLLTDDPPTLAEQREDVVADSCVHLYRRHG